MAVGPKPRVTGKLIAGSTCCTNCAGQGADEDSVEAQGSQDTGESARYWDYGTPNETSGMPADTQPVPAGG